MSSRIKVIDFAKEVQRNKTSLIQHCIDNGKYIDETASLSTVVQLNNTIESEDESLPLIRRIDYDGTILGEEYVEFGSELPAYPAPTPNDSRLTFVKWITQQTSGTVQHDLDYGALYECNVEKAIGSTTVHPTILDCCFTTETGLSPTIPIAPVAGHPVYIDWGDGTIDEVTSTTQKSHTYTQAGNYSIMLYSDAGWSFNTTTTRYILGSKVYNHALLKAIIGDKIITISQYQFQSCANLSSVIIPPTVQTLGNSILTGCTSLRAIIFPDGLTSIGGSMLTQCHSLSCAIIPADWSTLQSLFGSNYRLASIVIPDNVSSMTGSFSNCYSLNKIVLPAQLTSFGNSVFSGTLVSKIIVPNAVTNISPSLFSGCYSLTDVILTNNITSLGIQCFYQCYALRNISIPDGVVEIGTQAFSSCRSLNSITIPDGVTVINYSTFQGCWSLKSVTLPANLTSIGDGAFGENYSLQSITIPDGVISIGSNAFLNCYGVENLTIPLNWSQNINFINTMYSLTDESWASLGRRIADLTSGTSKVITLSSTQKVRISSIYVDSDGEITPAGTVGATTLLEYILNKNWTITVG